MHILRGAFPEPEPEPPNLAIPVSLLRVGVFRLLVLPGALKHESRTVTASGFVITLTLPPSHCTVDLLIGGDL